MAVAMNHQDMLKLVLAMCDEGGERVKARLWGQPGAQGSPFGVAVEVRRQPHSGVSPTTVP